MDIVTIPALPHRSKWLVDPVSPSHLGVLVNTELSQTEQWTEMVHNLVEAILCIHEWGSGATRVVDDWNMSERAREQDEPGEDEHCPYRRQHEVASIIEGILRLELMR